MILPYALEQSLKSMRESILVRAQVSYSIVLKITQPV